MHRQNSSATIRIRASIPDRPHRSIWARWTPRFPVRCHSGFRLLTPLAPLTPMSRGDINGEALG
jgi:hypothetical protein